MRIHHLLSVLFIVLAFTACTTITNEITQEPPKPGEPDRRVSVHVTAADLSAMGTQTEWLYLSEDMPAGCRIQAFHVNVQRRFHFSGDATSALVVIASDDGGEVIGSATIDDVHGIEGQAGEPARGRTYEETFTYPIGVWFRIAAVTGDGEPGAPFSLIATDEALAGEVTAEVILAAPALDVPQDAGAAD